MFISVNTISAPKEHMDRMVEGFRRNAPDMKRFAGFLGLEIWKGEDTLQAVSRWESREAFEAYLTSEAFRSHHGGAAGESRQGASTSARATTYEGEILA